MAETIDRVQVEVEATAKGTTAVFQQLESQLGTLKKALDSIDTSKLNKAAKVINTSGFAKAESEISSRIDGIKQSLAGLDAYKKAAFAGDNSSIKSFERKATSLQAQINEVGEALRQLGDNRAGINIDTDRFQALREELAEIQRMLNQSSTEMSEYAAEVNSQDPKIKTGGITEGLDKIKSAGKKILSVMKKVASGIKAAFAAAGSAIKKVGARMLGVSGGLDKTTSGFKHGLKTIIKYGFGVRSLYVLFRRLRKAVVDSFAELQKSGAMWQTTKANVEGLKTALSTLKFQFGAAFEPLFNFVAPALTSFINYLISLMNTISAFIAKLTGRSTYSKVAKVMTDTGGAAGSAAKATKELNKQLQAFDELNNISPENNSGGGGGGGGGGGSAGAMYEEASVDSALGDFANSLIENIKKGDWEKVGSLISEKLTKAMNSIKWEKVFEKARKFGTNLANFLNGLITPDLFEALGTTIGNAIKTKLEFLNSFGKTFNWKNFGHSIATGLKAFVNTHPLVLAAETFSTWAVGITSTLATAINDALDNGTIQTISDDITKALKKINIGEIAWNVGQIVSGLANSLYILVSNKETWKELGNKISEGINKFLESMATTNPTTGLNGWEAAGKTVSNLASGLLTTITKAIEDIHWDEVGQGIADFIKNIEWGDLVWDLAKLALAIGDALVEAIKGLFKEGTLLENLGIAIVGILALAKLTGLSEALSGLIAGALEGTSLNLTAAGLKSFGLTVAGVVVALEGGLVIGNNLGELFATAIGDDELASYYAEYDSWGKIIGEFCSAWKDGTLLKILLQFGQEIWDKMKWLWDKLKGFFDLLLTPLKAIWDLLLSLAKKLGVEKDWGAGLTNWASNSINEAYVSFRHDDRTHIGTEKAKNAPNYWMNTHGDVIYKHYVYDDHGNIIGVYYDDTYQADDGYVQPGETITVEAPKVEIPETEVTGGDGKEGAIGNFWKRSADSYKEGAENFKKQVEKSDKEVKDSLEKAKLDITRNVSANYNVTSNVNYDDAYRAGQQMGNALQNGMDNAFSTDEIDRKLNEISDAEVKVNMDLDKDIKDYNQFKDYMRQLDKLKNEYRNIQIKIKTDMTDDVEDREALERLNEELEKLQQLWHDNDAHLRASVGGQLKEPGDINSWATSMMGLHQQWHNNEATMKANVGGQISKIDDLNGWKTTVENLQKSWGKTTNAAFTTSADTKAASDGLKTLTDISKNWAGSGKKATFTAEFTNASTNAQGYKDFVSLYDNWYGTTAKFDVEFNVSGVPNIQTGFQNIADQLNAALSSAGIKAHITAPVIGKAEGGVATSPTFAVWGEAGAEALLPLERNLGWLRVISGMMIEGMENSPKLKYAATPPSTSYAYTNSDGYATYNNDLMAEQNRLIQQQNDLLEQILEKPTGISSRDVFQAVRSESSDYFKRTGVGAFAY